MRNLAEEWLHFLCNTNAFMAGNIAADRRTYWFLRFQWRYYRTLVSICEAVHLLPSGRAWLHTFLGYTRWMRMFLFFSFIVLPGALLPLYKAISESQNMAYDCSTQYFPIHQSAVQKNL